MAFMCDVEVAMAGSGVWFEVVARGRLRLGDAMAEG